MYRGMPNSVLVRSAGFADPVADAEIVRLRAELALATQAYTDCRRFVLRYVRLMERELGGNGRQG